MTTRYSATSRMHTVGRIAGAISAGTVSALVGATVARWWMAGDQAAPTRPLNIREVAVPPVSVTTASGVRIHGIQTGFVAIKTAHHTLREPKALRLLSIIVDQHWTAVLPILTWLIEHPTGLIVVDTGEVAAAADVRTYMARDPANAWFFGRNLRLLTTPQEEIAAQLQTLGFAADEVGTVVMTHLHEDHTAGLGFFPQAKIVIARAEYEGHQQQPLGAVPSLWPQPFAPHLIDYDGPGLDPFPATYALTPDADVLVVPTPGHSYGHQSVIVRDGQTSYMLAGDLAFSEQQLRARGLQGICQDVDASRQTLERVWRYVQQTPTVFLPTHDPNSLARLAKRQIVQV